MREAPDAPAPAPTQLPVQVAERILARDPASPDLIPLVRHLDEPRLAQLAADSVGKLERAELILEIARHAPEVMRPRVPGTKRGMMFVGSIDLAAPPLGWELGRSGIVYCFFDDESRVAVSLRQAP